MNPIKKEQDNKKIISTVKELNELNKILRDTPWVKLDKPIQTGWTKCHKLRDDCASRDDADTFKRILDTIDVSVFCRKQDFKDRKGVVMNAGLKVIRENHWVKLNWPESYKKYFLFGTYLVEYDSDSRGYAHYYSTKKSVVGFKIKQEFYFEEIGRAHV